MNNLFYWNDIKDGSYTFIHDKPNHHPIGKGKHTKTYIEVYSGFDIETTQLPERKTSYMYIWQFSINSQVIVGRTWTEFIEFLKWIQEDMKLSSNNRLVVWVANLSYEFQFMRTYLNVTHIFAKTLRQPLLVEHNNCIEFREALSISGGSLAHLAKNYTTTQKLVGDLDYSIMRNSNTQLSDQELLYCMNDVIILSEWSEYIFKEYISKGFFPLTKTAILRNKVSNNLNDNIKDIIFRCYPPDSTFYRLLMKWCFRGGFVHSNIIHTNKTITQLMDGVDFTSSYPAVMEQCYFPKGFYKEEKNRSGSHYEKLNETKCTLALITFNNIEATTPHSIESLSKCIRVSPERIIDNGRIRQADYITVALTELDYEIYTLFYQWDDIKIEKLYYTERGSLPGYLLSVLEEYYTMKNQLKKEGKFNTTEYALAKEMVNSAFGMCVTRMVEEDFHYDNDTNEWSKEPRKIIYDKEREKAILLPQWGVYVSAHARHRLLKMVHKIGSDVVYCDTDSIKMLNYEKHEKLIDEYNAAIMNQNKEICKKRNLDYNLFYDLGCFDLETKDNQYRKFKTLGAKRYIYEDNSGLHTTIAGLPKKSLDEHCKHYNLDPFDFFSDNMMVNISNKLTTHYNDEPHTDIVDGELMEENTSVCLYHIDFTMKVDKGYLLLMEEYQKRRKKARND